VVGDITRSFASFWDSECASMKTALVDMDRHHTGRVPLSKFYSSALDSEWRFGESESYLRELGALDETSTWHGKQVIIPNYLLAASNCIVSTPHYLVCCINECEGILREIEDKVQGEVARPGEILALVSNITSQTTIDHDDHAHITVSLKAQLEQIAAGNGGVVPVHGRLFAQWLHYVFPRECPFPHKMGMASSRTPTEFGDEFVASKHEMKTHAETAGESDALAIINKEELQWMSQWSSEEELIVDDGQPARASWETPVATLGVLLLLAGGMVTSVGVSRRTLTSEAGLLPTHSKSHFV